MAVNPEERYVSARMLAEDVTRWLDDRPVTAQRESPFQRLARWSRRHRAWIVAGTASLALITLLSVAFSVQQIRSADRLRTERDRTRQESRRAFQSLSDLSLERGRKMAETRDPAGLLYLARALAIAPQDDEARQYTARQDLAQASLACHELKFF
jgi:hypothetical protein